MDLVLQDRDVFVERGIVLFGGEDGSGARKHDLWLFDLTNSDVIDGTLGDAPSLDTDPADPVPDDLKRCRWHLLNDDVGFGLSRGTLSIVPDREQLVLVGGWHDAGGEDETASTIWTMNLADLASSSPTWGTWSASLPDSYATRESDAKSAAYGSADDWFCEGDFSKTWNWTGTDGTVTPIFTVWLSA